MNVAGGPLAGVTAATVPARKDLDAAFDLKQVSDVEKELDMPLGVRRDFRRWLHQEKRHRWDSVGPHDHLDYKDLLQAGKDYLKESGVTT